MNDKHGKSERDLQQIEKALLDIGQKRLLLKEIHQEVQDFYVYSPNVEKTESDLKQLRLKVESEIIEARNLCVELRNTYNKAQQLVPSDIAQELNQLELLTESIVGAMEEKDREFKKAKTVRSDYLNDVEDLQTWIKDAEIKVIFLKIPPFMHSTDHLFQVQDRSTEPHVLQETLQQVQSELASATDKLEKVTKNGKTLMENSRDSQDKQQIQVTINTLTEQLQQVKSWLDEKRQQVGETLDAWQRFLTLYKQLMEWVQEKKVFLQEPLFISTLPEAKQKLHDYSVSYDFNHVFTSNKFLF